MTDEIDKNLAYLFAAHAEELDGAAFTAKVSRRIVRRRNLEYLNDLGPVIVAGVAVVALAPFMRDAATVIAEGSKLLTTAMTSFAVTPFAWLGAGIVGLFTIMWVRV